MPRLRTRTWTALLLFAGGLVLGLLGVRGLALERGQADRRARELERRRLAQAVADAPRLARQPRGAPVTAWQTEPARLSGSDGEPDAALWTALREARTGDGSPALQFERWMALAAPQQPAWLRHLASYRAARLAFDLHRDAQGEALLGVALQAHPLLVSDGVRVRASALQQLALRGVRRGDSRPLERFLEAALDGNRLVVGDVVGPDDLLVALAARVAGDEALALGVQGERLQAAARRAGEGIALLAHVPRPGDHALVGEQVVLHTDLDLQVRDVQSLVAPPDGFPARAHAALRPPGTALDRLSARLAAPFEAVVVRIDPEPLQAKSLLSLLALALGLGLYGVGAVLALRGWQRSRAAAHMQADFTAAVSHELKTPIASVRAMAEMLGAGAADPEMTRRYAERIEREMQRLGATVANVLDAARVERGALPVHLRPGDPLDPVRRAVAAQQPVLEQQGFVVETALEPATAPLAVDSDALQGVLLNLLDNAAKFAGTRRHVRIEAGPAAGGGYRIAVLDRGLGLEGEQHRHLFERFQRGAAARAGAVPGVGLGLHIAWQVIVAHGGTLRARGREGGGAAFEIHLPGEAAR